MAKKSITMKPLSQQDEDLVFLDEETDLSYWEFINQSDADESDTESLLSLENGFVSWYTLSSSLPPPPKSSDTQLAIQDPDLVVNYSDDHVSFYFQPEAASVIYDDIDDDVKEDEDEDDEEEYDGYGLDDELVPWNVSGKLGRQRMRKLGKRAFSKMGNSKRNPYLHVKPGAVHGKHGLGIKA